MVRITTLNDRIKDTIEKLFLCSSDKSRCPYIRKDEKGPYCSKDLKSNKISKNRRMVCDIYSLQLWCLDKEDYQKCIFYQGEKIDSLSVI